MGQSRVDIVKPPERPVSSLLGRPPQPTFEPADEISDGLGSKPIIGVADHGRTALADLLDDCIPQRPTKRLVFEADRGEGTCAVRPIPSGETVSAAARSMSCSLPTALWWCW